MHVLDPAARSAARSPSDEASDELDRVMQSFTARAEPDGPAPDPFFSDLIRRLSDRVAESVRSEVQRPLSVEGGDEGPPAIDREAATG